MYEEIVTKAVIAKGKRLFDNKYEYTLSEEANDILGCYIMNHKMEAIKENDKVRINGFFDVNIWYAFDNNTKTKVDFQRINYSELIDIKIKEGSLFDETSEIEIHASKKPVVTDASSSKSILKYEVVKELEVEVLGNTKVRIQTIPESSNDNIDDIIENEINAEYLG